MEKFLNPHQRNFSFQWLVFITDNLNQHEDKKNIHFSALDGISLSSVMTQDTVTFLIMEGDRLLR